MIGALQAHDQSHTIEFNTLSGKVDQNIADIAKKANSADVYTKGETDALIAPFAKSADVYTKGEADALINVKANASDVYTKAEVNGELAKKLEASALTPYAKTEDVAKTYATIAALESIYKAGEGEAEATGILAEEIARAKAAEKDLDDAIKLLTNGAGTSEIDSVKELIDYVNNHGATVEGINDRLDGHDTLLAGIGGEGQPATVIAAINAAKYTLPGATVEALGGIKSAADVDGKIAVNKVYVDTTTNIAEVKAVSTDALVNGSEELVLFGGNSGAQAE